MSRHDPTVALAHMVRHAAEAVELTRGKARQNLDPDRLSNWP